MRMLVTRPEPDAQATIERLAALGIDGIAMPLMTRQTLPVSLPPADGFAAMALTSTNALRSLADRGELAPWLDKPVFAVGDRTAHEARLLGFAAVTAADGDLDSLVTSIARSQLQGPVFYPAGRHLSGDLAHALAPFGLMVVTTPIYEMVAQTVPSSLLLEQLADGAIAASLFYSRRTAEIFCDHVALPPQARRALPMLCLSENVAGPLLDNHFSRIMLADHPSEDAMMALALAFAREQTGP